MRELLPAGAFCLSPFLFASAMLLDFLIGDPRRLPHPVRQMGWLIEKTESVLRPYLHTPRQQRQGGLMMVALVLTITFLAAWLATEALLALPRYFSLWVVSGAAWVLLIYLTATTLALRELLAATARVAKLVEAGSLKRAREELSLIVGRDTSDLSPRQIQKALMETLAENLSDGVIAPMFYLLLGGLPAALVYKAINTMDSMVGYKNSRYLHFGRAAARLDDLANYLPARISAALIALAAGLGAGKPALVLSSLQTMRAEGRKHASPNAGLPEAALAGALGVCLGGPASYGGILMDKPCFGRERRQDYATALDEAGKIVLLSSFLFFLAGLTVLLLLN